VHARGIDPTTVVAFTFSRRAAAELRARVARMDATFVEPMSNPGPAPHGQVVGGGTSLAVPSRPPLIWAGTIHSFGVRVLRRGGAGHFERRPNFTVHDDDDTERTVRRVLDDLGVRQIRRRRSGSDAPDGGASLSDDRVRSDDPVDVAMRGISLVKRTEITPADTDVTLEGTTFPRVFEAYEEALRIANAFDFDDLIALATRALETDRSLRDRVRARVRHLLVDEFQDTDGAQARLIEVLDPPDLCVVADPEQSIYGFRGASPDVVRWVSTRWPDAGVVRLERNYRSTGRIVAVAQRVRDAAPVEHDDRTRLRQWTRAAVGEPVRLWATNHPEREARLIAIDVAERLAAGVKPDDVAVLVRTRAQLRVLEAVLVELETVPYEVVGGTPFFGRAEVRDILAYLRVGVSPDDAAAFWRVINVPRRGLGPAAAIAIGRESVSADAESRAPEAAMRRLAARDRLPDGAFDFLAIVDEVRARISGGAPLGETVQLIVEATAYREHLQREHSADAVHRVARLESLATIANRFDDARRFLDDAILATTVDGPASPGGRVRVSTIHAAKGTEYDHVYVAGCEDGILPIINRDQGGFRAGTPDHDHSPRQSTRERYGFDPEERRIFYVAVTRPRRTLTLSYASFRHNRRARPSPFLEEVGSDLLLRCEPGTAVPLPIPARRRPPSSSTASTAGFTADPMPPS
jgi:superfamily I DNA/RNA helicase